MAASGPGAAVRKHDHHVQIAVDNVSISGPSMNEIRLACNQVIEENPEEAGTGQGAAAPSDTANRNTTGQGRRKWTAAQRREASLRQRRLAAQRTTKSHSKPKTMTAGA